MANIKININGLELKGFEGQSILDVALENGIEIPTLCYDERVKTYGSCGVCVVEVENSPRLLRACSTAIADGMIIKTDTKRVYKTRQIALELLLSDHTGDCRPPCVLACPGHTDCQGYVGLIANGQYKEALELIKDKIPMPSCIGRVCPHPCEEACRRKMVEEPISIAQLKYFVGDIDLGSEDIFRPEVKPETGKTVAVIGGGPGGLTAAYFLRREGHSVTVYDAMPKMGGMLRYGIPEYRLPKKVVDDEVVWIEELGVKMANGVKIGKDITFSHIKENHNATVVAIGAWSSTDLGCPGEDLEGVVGGIDFLRDVATNTPMLSGEKVAVVGGGNTAMDACRTAIRLGASEVYNIYRRTKAEMPAEEIEIVEAEEEGVVFKNLTNPIEVVGQNGKVSHIRLQIMALGEPDASGRRAPVPVEGKEEMLEVDTVIVAIGQGVNPSGFEELALTKKKTIVSDETTYRTNIEGVFAIGDAINKGASIAIAAIGDAKRAADVIGGYLQGQIVPYIEPFIVKRDLTPEDFKEYPKVPREKMTHLKPKQRRDNFHEVNYGYTEEQAKKEAARCLECGCADFFECKLIDYANKYDVKPSKYKGEVHNRPLDLSNPFMYRNPDKCILCGLCIRVCDEVMGRTALGFMDRGFDTIVKPSLGLPLTQTDCISCGQCVTLCPVGALGEIPPIPKSVPFKEHVTSTVCSFCSVGCRTKVTTKGKLQVRSLPDDDKNKTAILCAKGRFGFGELQKQVRLTKPLIRKEGQLKEVPFNEAFIYVTKKAQSLGSLYGNDSIAVSVSDKYTNEEIFAINKYAREVLKTNNVYSFNMNKSGLKEVLGIDASPNTFDELESTNVIIMVCLDIVNSHTIAGLKIKRAVENGAKLILVSNEESQADEWATIKIPFSKNLDTLKEILKALIDLGAKPDIKGFDELSAYVQSVSVSPDIKEVAQMYFKAKKAMIVYDRKGITTDAARLIGDIALISGHIGKARDGIVELKPNNNSQGLIDMGIDPDGEHLEQKIADQSIKGLLIFGEDIPEINVEKLEFLMVQDVVLTETAEKAHVILPAAAPFETSGTYTSTERVIQKVNKALPSPFDMENWQIVKALSNVSYEVLSYESDSEILKQIDESVFGYRGCASKDLSNEKIFIPVDNNPILCIDGADSLLVIPKGNIFSMEKPNTNTSFNRFMNFMDSKGLIK